MFRDQSGPLIYLGAISVVICCFVMKRVITRVRNNRRGLGLSPVKRAMFER